MPRTHTNTHTIYIYIYIYIFGQHFLVEAYLMKQYRHFLSTYFYIYPCKLSYRCYDIRPELVNKPSYLVLKYFRPHLGPLSGGGYCEITYNLTDNTTILEQQNNKDNRFLKPYTSETNILNSTELILNPVQMYSNVFSCCCCCYLKSQFSKLTIQYTSINNKRLILTQ